MVFLLRMTYFHSGNEKYIFCDLTMDETLLSAYFELRLKLTAHASTLNVYPFRVMNCIFPIFQFPTHMELSLKRLFSLNMKFYCIFQ